MKQITMNQPETPQEFVDHYTRRGLELILQMQNELKQYGSALPQTIQAFEGVKNLLGQVVIDTALGNIKVQQDQQAAGQQKSKKAKK